MEKLQYRAASKKTVIAVDESLLQLCNRFVLNMPKVRAIAIDESLCRAKMRFSFKVFMRDKPGRYGILLRVACDPDTKYCIRLKLYSGKLVSDNNTYVEIFNYLLAGFN